MTDADELRVTGSGERWRIEGRWRAGDRQLCNDYLGYLGDRRYSPASVRAYAFDLLHFARWLDGAGIGLVAVSTETLLKYLAACRADPPARPARQRGPAPQRAGGRVRTRHHQPAPRCHIRPVQLLVHARPGRSQPCAPGPCSPADSQRATHRAVGPPGPAKLEVCPAGEEPRRLPRGLDRSETAALLGSFRTERDRAIAGLMLFSGLRSAEVLGLSVADIDIGRGWARVVGKGDKERRVPVDPDVASLVQSYVLAERPETASRALFVVAKGPHRGQPLSPAGLGRVFRYHRKARAWLPGTLTPCATASAPRWPRRAWTWPCSKPLWATTTSIRPLFICIWPLPICELLTMPPVPASAPGGAADAPRCVGGAGRGDRNIRRLPGLAGRPRSRQQDLL